MSQKAVLFFSLLLASVFGEVSCLGQTSQSYMNDTGSTAYGVTIPVENGYINVSNGNLHLEFPLASAPQRGALSLNEKLVYDSRIWMFSPFGSKRSYHWWPTNVYGSAGNAGGWRLVTGNETGAISSGGQSSYSSEACDPDDDRIRSTEVDQIVWTDPGGTAHPFNAFISSYNDACANSYTQNVSSGLATDGSGYSASDDGNGDPLIVDSSGTQVYPVIIDRYGNSWSGDGNGNLVDDTGRTPVLATQSGNTTYYDVLAANGPINNQGTRVRYTVTATPMTVSSNFQDWSDSDIHQWCNGCASANNINLFAPVTSIQLPDGSQYSFGYDGTGELNSVTLPTGGVVSYGYNNIFDSSNTENRWLVSRTVGSDPATTFTPSVVASCTNYSNGCVERVTMHKPSGDETVYTLTLNNGAWNTGTTVYTGAASNNQTLADTTSVNTYTNPCSATCTGASYVSQSLSTTTLYPTGMQTQTQSFFNAWNGKPSTVKQWDYIPSGQAFGSTPTRETDYTYTGNDPFQVTVLDSAGNQAGQTTYSYTSTASASNVTMHHGTVNSGGPYLQSVSHWLNTGGSSTVWYGMDDSGQVVSATDPKSNPSTTFTYQCANSLPYQIINSLGQVTTYGYDCGSGMIASVQDPNDLANSRSGTTYHYESTVGRLQTVTAPDGGTTTYSYPSSLEVDTAVSALPNPTIYSSQVLDGYGRPYQEVSAQRTSETTYDTNGRPYCTTTPHQVGAASNGSTCITSYDGLDRPLTQLQADGSSTLRWLYSGNVATSYDEANNAWVRTSNAFGQLSSVVEPGGLQTSYLYDGLGNATTVNQQGIPGSDTPRVRSFAYDSMSRLLTAQSPESGLICYGVWSGPNCIDGYDANGNLVNKTDARNVTVNYAYDALNRVTAEQGPGIANVYQYDQAAQGSFTAENPLGRLTWASNSRDADVHYSYDPMGRVKHQEGCTPQHCFVGANPLNAQYDQAGNMTSLTYPDGRVVTQGFDPAGNMTNVGYSSWNGTPMNQNYFNAAGGYDAAGHLVSGSFGNTVPVNAAYDTRERIQSLSYGPSNALRWAKQYGWTPNGNLQTATDTILGVQRQFGYDSLNRLKSAQDLFASSSAPGASSGGSSTGGSSTSGPSTLPGTGGAVPWWTDPDDSNGLPNFGEPNASWDTGDSRVSLNAGAAPDGTATATLVSAPGSAGSGDFYIAGYVPTAYAYSGETVTGSVWLRSASGTQTVNLYKIDQGPNGRQYGGSRQITVTPTWQQFQVTGPVQGSLTGLALQVGGAGTFTGGQSFYMWNPMMEDAGIANATVTNFLPFSQRFTAASWGQQLGTATDNAAQAPDGTNSAAVFTVNAANGPLDSWLVDSVPNPAPYSNAAVTGSVWLRVASGTQPVLLTLIESGAQPLGAQTVHLTTDWRRFQVTGTTQGNLSQLQLQIGGAGTLTNGQSIQMWGAQMELASTVGPYVATGSAAVTQVTALTNLLPYSQQLGSSWAAVAAGAQPSAAPAPDGSMTATSATGNNGFIIDSVLNPALYNNAQVTGSVYLRSESGTQPLTISMFGDSVGNRIYFASVTANLTTTWQRFQITGVAPNGLARLGLQVGDNGGLLNGVPVDMWGMQMELAPSAGPYVATSALPVIAGRELTNILPDAQQINGSTWGFSGVAALNLNSDTAPDGTPTAATVSSGGPGVDAYATDTVMNPSLYDQQTVTASVYLRSPGGTIRTNLYLIQSGDNGWDTSINQSLTITSSWQRYALTGTLQNGLTALLMQLGGAGTFSNNENIEIWGPQLVIGSSAAPYLGTTGGTAGGSATNLVTGQPGTLVQNGMNTAYAYDSFGNLLQNGGFSSTYMSSNRMFGYSYDAAGNLLSDGINAMQWDAKGRLAASGGTTYSYDIFGNRAGKQGAALVDTVYFAGRPIARYTAGQWTDLVYGPTGLIAEVPGTQAGLPVYRVADPLGTTVGSLLADGTFVNPVDYTPFGQVFSGTTADPYLFTGLEHDPESGSEHAAFRQYTSNQGRWTSPDPYDGSMDFGNPQSLNRYSYVLNNPLGFVDPSGLDHAINCGLYCGGVSTEEPDNFVDLITAFIDTLVDFGDALEAAFGFGHPQMKETNQFQRRCLGTNCGRSNTSTDPKSQSGSFKYVNLVFGDPAPSKPNPKCATPIMQPAYTSIFGRMGSDLGVNPLFIMSSALQESGWNLAHVFGTNSSSGGKPLNNLFGMTRAGGNNIAYPSVWASAQAWESNWGPYLTNNPQTIQAYAADLTSNPAHMYNSNPAYPGALAARYNQLVGATAACKVTF